MSMPHIPEEVLSLLAEDQQRRFHSFFDLKPRWYVGGEGKPLSPVAVEQFLQFGRVVKSVLPRASLFMGLEGSIEVMWHEENRCICDIEFFDDRIEYWRELTDEEGVVVVTDTATDIATIATVFFPPPIEPL